MVHRMGCRSPHWTSNDSSHEIDYIAVRIIRPLGYSSFGAYPVGRLVGGPWEVVRIMVCPMGK